jgi:predicted site-specific integrase-resolvase
MAGYFMEAHYMQLPDVTPFATWLKDNNISHSTGYRLVREGKLKIVKIHRRSYVTKNERERFLQSLSA